MSNLKFSPFLRGECAGSILIGAPDSFDLLSTLRTASSVQMALAFGHMSGWREVSESLTKSSARAIDILLGQAFYQTEPELLDALRSLTQESLSPKFEIRLASQQTTFHPKVWIMEHARAHIAIVGSGNLSGGRLRSNVEVGIFTSSADHVSSIRTWFDDQWSRASCLEEAYDDYVSRYERLLPDRRPLLKRLHQEMTEQAAVEHAKRRPRLPQPRLTKDQLSELLEEGRRIPDWDYVAHTKTNSAKTFYLLCKRLKTETPNALIHEVIPGKGHDGGFLHTQDDLLPYIKEQIAHNRFPLKKGFNPNQWFSERWTIFEEHGRADFFKAEYTYILDRFGPPFWYRIKPECIGMVRDVFAELEN